MTWFFEYIVLKKFIGFVVFLVFIELLSAKRHSAQKTPRFHQPNEHNKPNKLKEF